MRSSTTPCTAPKITERSRRTCACRAWCRHRRHCIPPKSSVRVIAGLLVSGTDSFERLKDLELFFGKRSLPCAAIGLGEPIMRLRDSGLERGCAAQLLDRFGVALLVGQQYAELEKPARECGIECHRARQQCCDAPKVLRLRARPRYPPPAERIVQVGHGIVRVRLDETSQALRHL